MGGLIIHLFLIPLLFAGIATIVKEGYQERFIDQVRSDANYFSTLLARHTDLQEVQSYLDEALLEGRLIFARVINEGRTIVDGMRFDAREMSFIEDFFFGQHEDQVYYIALPIDGAAALSAATVQLGYDESPIHEQIDSTYRNGLLLAFAYTLASMLFGTLMGSQVTRPLRRLRDAAREIASGAATKQLDVSTKISEVESLAANLESMRAELVRSNDAIASREMYTRDIMNSVIEGILTVNQDGYIEALNPAVENIFGFPEQELLGKSLDTLITPTFWKSRLGALIQSGEHEQTTLALQQGKFVETTGRRKNGGLFPLEVSVGALSIQHGGHCIAVIRDITERKKAEDEIKALHQDLERRVIQRTQELAAANERLKYQALHDALTDLPNRVLLEDRLQQAIQTAQRDNKSLALMILDLNNFKEINDTLGHQVGDLLLQRVALRLLGSLRESDTISRTGGDEFALLLPGVAKAEDSRHAALKLIAEMEEDFILEEQSFHVGISIGIALYPQHGTDGPTLMRHADVAMYVSKRTKSGYSVYDPSCDDHSVSKLALMGELRHAIGCDELVLYYQPKIDLATGKICELEALARWQHQHRGLLTPDSFIHLAEQKRLIHPLTRWAINEALQQCHAYRQANIEISVAVNLSTHSLRDIYLSEQISELLELYELPAKNLVLEITESAAMSDPPHTIEILGHLHEMGVRLAIDDFGTGYSSLSYLKQLPVDEIKIDKSFILDMVENNEDLVIVRSTIDLAHNMGRTVTAEGVETREALDKLVELGCDMVQGYYIAPPMPGEEFEPWLRHHNESFIPG